MNIETYIDSQVNKARKIFDEELSTDENKDYRRGFRAGLLVAYLQLKSNIGNLNDAITEQSTD